MALMVFKAVFCAIKQGVWKDIIKTITIDTDYRGYGFGVQSAIDSYIINIKKEGYERVELKDIQNISTPIIMRKKN